MSVNKPGMVAHICNLRYMRDIGRRQAIMVQGKPWQKCETLSEKKITKNTERAEDVIHVVEFKPQYHHQKKEKWI
jgi:hypothetical protein